MIDPATLAQLRRDAQLVANGERHPLKTGACLAGWHEGSRPKDRNGRPVKTCAQYDVCPCSCHTDLDELFEISGRPRVLVENPEYHPVIPEHFRLITIEAPSPLAAEQPKIESDVLVSPAPGIVPGVAMREFTPTPTGRMARGELEHHVKVVVDTWVIENEKRDHRYRIPCTAMYVADKLQEMGVESARASTIINIFHKWDSSKIAEIGQNPIQFIKYTSDAITNGIDRMHAMYKRERKMAF